MSVPPHKAPMPLALLPLLPSPTRFCMTAAKQRRVMDELDASSHTTGLGDYPENMFGRQAPLTWRRVRLGALQDECNDLHGFAQPHLVR